MRMGMGMGKSIFTSTPSSSTLRATRGMRSTVLARHLPQQPPLGKDLDQGHISRRTISSSSPRRVKNWDLKELERLVKESKERLRKLEDEAGKPLKRTTALHMSIAECLRWKPESEEDNVVVQGYIRSVRGMKTHRFVSLGDGSSLAPLQAVVPVDTNQAEGCDHYSSSRAISPSFIMRVSDTKSAASNTDSVSFPQPGHRRCCPSHWQVGCLAWRVPVS